MTVRKTLFAATSKPPVALALAAAPAVMAVGGWPRLRRPSRATRPASSTLFVAAFSMSVALRTVYTERLQQTTDETEQQAIVEEGKRRHRRRDQRGRWNGCRTLRRDPGGKAAKDRPIPPPPRISTAGSRAACKRRPKKAEPACWPGACRMPRPAHRPLPFCGACPL